MMQSSPTQPQVDRTLLEQCIQACFDCTQTCTACADACLAEPQREMLLRCIRLDLDCADICNATGRIISRQTAFDSAAVRAVLQACAQVCHICGDECEHHSQMEHCRVCAQACRHCEQACNQVVSALR
jgi:hypothetical protein